MHDCRGSAHTLSPINPFQVLIGQKVSGIPQLSAGSYRTIFLIVALALWIAGTMRHARRVQAPVAPAENAPSGPPALGFRTVAVLAIVVATFAIFVYGVAALH